MKTYIFNVSIFNLSAINTVPEAIEGAYKNRVVTVKAMDIDSALKEMRMIYKSDKQFRFEWAYIGSEELNKKGK